MKPKRSIVPVLLGVGLVLVIAGWWFFRAVDGVERVAIIRLEGVIAGGRGQGGLWSDGGGTDAVIRQIQEVREDREIKAVVIRINSPGGSAPASQEVGEEIKKLRAAGKITVASMGDIAASGGYWIAALCDRIYANPGTITGSIGIYIPYANWQELMKKVGIQGEKIKSGPHKDMLSPERPMTEKERAIVQAMVDDLYEQFIVVVAEGRKMETARVRELADGRIYTGRQAKSLGLIDETGTMEEAVKAAAQMAGITGKPVIKEFGRGGFWEALFGSAAQVLLEGLRNQLIEAGLTGGAVEWRQPGIPQLR